MRKSRSELLWVHDCCRVTYRCIEVEEEFDIICECQLSSGNDRNLEAQKVKE